MSDGMEFEEDVTDGPRFDYVVTITRGGYLRYLVSVTNLTLGGTTQVQTLTHRGARREALRLIVSSEVGHGPA